MPSVQSELLGLAVLAVLLGGTAYVLGRLEERRHRWLRLGVMLSSPWSRARVFAAVSASSYRGPAPRFGGLHDVARRELVIARAMRRRLAWTDYPPVVTRYDRLFPQVSSALLAEEAGHGR